MNKDLSSGKVNKDRSWFLQTEIKVSSRTVPSSTQVTKHDRVEQNQSQSWTLLWPDKKKTKQ